jgi:hypothetical protein
LLSRSIIGFHLYRDGQFLLTASDKKPVDWTDISIVATYGQHDVFVSND